MQKKGAVIWWGLLGSFTLIAVSMVFIFKKSIKNGIFNYRIKKWLADLKEKGL